ncbi:MAG: CpsD/CapB family tyrosine-protein kinase [Nitrospira sp.]|nr:CpsD/CapB family tyrosine-protein kinase [bacterium]MBL7047979.1 CpsD/CapB family tyrosine-protein kinase [Nitrospira sp.]
MSIKQFKKTGTKEELNALYVKILQAATQRKVKTIMISSCNRREGTSTIALNLAHIFAQETSRKVLLVDANLRHASLAGFFGVVASPGLGELVSGQADIASAVRETDRENLNLLAAGAQASSPLDIFNSDALHNCIAELEKVYQYIIIDSAPVMPYADSLFLAARVDIMLLLLEAGRTRWEVAEEALKKLSNVGVEVFGTILNKKKFNIPSFIYNRL